MLGGIICAVAGIALTAWATATSPIHTRPAPGSSASRQMQNLCRKIGREQEKLDELNRMLIDIDLCSPDEIMKGFRCIWESGGTNRQYDFIVDGASPTSDDMRRMVYAEACRVEARLCDLVDELVRLRHPQNVPKTMRE